MNNYDVPGPLVVPMASISTSSAASIQAAKQLLRQHIRNSLSKIDESSLSAQGLRNSLFDLILTDLVSNTSNYHIYLLKATTVTSRVLTHPSYLNAKRISVYLSMPTSELRTDEIMRHALLSRTWTLSLSRWKYR